MAVPALAGNGQERHSNKRSYLRRHAGSNERFQARRVPAGMRRTPLGVSKHKDEDIFKKPSNMFPLELQVRIIPCPVDEHCIFVWQNQEATGLITNTLEVSVNHLVRSLIVFALSLFVVTTAHAQQKTYRIGYILSTESQLGAGAIAFADAVAKQSGNKIKIEQQPNAALGGEVEMLNGLQLGTVDFAFITGAPLPNIIPAVGVFNIPFIFRDIAHAHAVLDSPLGLSYLEKFKDKEMVALAWGENGLRHITNSKRPIKTPEDIKGLKLRLPQSDVMRIGFKELGVDTVSLPFPQVFGALQSGQIDGQENPISTIVSSKFAQVQQYLSLTGHVYDPAVILVSKATWEELSGEEQAILVEAAKVGAKASRDYNAKEAKAGVENLRKQGMEVTDQIDRAKFAAAVQPAYPEFEKMYGAAVIKQIQDTK